MSVEIKTCQNCKKEFRIEPEDLLFYEKIKVPSPTWCPECRLIRRLSHITFANLYKRKCDLCKNDFVSVYSQDKPYTVYCNSCWWSDKWDPLDYGMNYDFSRPFFDQFNELLRRVPLLGIHTDYPALSVNAPYNNLANNMKNCYMLFEATTVENSAYAHFIKHSNECYDSFFIEACELSYDNFHCYKNYHGIYLNHTNFSSDSLFLWQCSNCQNSFASANLQHKNYYIFNQPYSLEDYARKLEEFNLGSYKSYTRLKEEARKHWLKYPVKTFWDEFSSNVSGLFVFESKRCVNCFEVYGVEDSKWTTFIESPKVRDAYDYSGFGINTELMYECSMVGENAYNIKFFAAGGFGVRNSEYSTLCMSNVDNLFGCISLRGKKYCILNKQYTEEEYKALLSKTINHMNEMPYTDAKGRIYRYGEFFPFELSTIAYNESYAYQYFPLSKEEALERGYAWRDAENGQHKITITAPDLPDHIRDTADSILQETIGCASCGRGYRIIPQELDFYRRINVPLPRQCFFCRLREKMQEQPNPMRLIKRRCQCVGKKSSNGVYENQFEHLHGLNPCNNEFETSYSSDKPEIVYCKTCYQSEVA